MKYDEVVLKNSVKTYIFPEKGVKTFSLKLVFDGIGAAYDPKGKEGLYNLLFSMLERGTKNYPSFDKLNYELELIGAFLSANAGREVSSITINGVSDSIEKAIEILKEVAFSPIFLEEELEREKVTTLLELESIENNPLELTQKKFIENIFKGSPFAHNIRGTKESLRKITLEDIKLAHRDLLRQSRPVIFVGGDVERDRVVSSLEKELPMLGGGHKDMEIFSKGLKEGNRVVSLDRELDQPVFFLGMQIGGSLDDDYFSLQVASTIFGGGFGSMMMQEVREKRSLAYYASGQGVQHKKVGTFFAYAGVNKENLNEAIRVSLKQFERLADGDFTKIDLERAINYKAGLSEVARESLGNKLSFYANSYILWGKIMGFEEYEKLIRRVTADDIAESISNVISNGFLLVVNGVKKLDKDRLVRLLNEGK